MEVREAVVVGGSGELLLLQLLLLLVTDSPQINEAVVTAES
jgi:hypothetical protein